MAKNGGHGESKEIGKRKWWRRLRVSESSRRRAWQPSSQTGLSPGMTTEGDDDKGEPCVKLRRATEAAAGVQSGGGDRHADGGGRAAIGGRAVVIGRAASFSVGCALGRPVRANGESNRWRSQS
ncbi:hypothetical protein Dimus_014229 [Dionaea muscipula]